MCAANAHNPGLDCCIKDEKLWCDTGCQQPDCTAVYGCRYCDCRHTPQLQYMDRSSSVTILRHPSDDAPLDGAALEVRVQLAELGALEAACVALNSHPSEPGVVAYACDLLFAVCSGHDPNHRRKVQAADADAIPAIIESLKKAKGKKNSEHAIEAAYNALDLVAAGGQNLMDAAVALGYTPPEASLEA